MVEVRGNHFNREKRACYLDAVPLNETLTATVDWHGHTPYQIRWITPQATSEDPISGTTATRSFNMGTDFGPGGTLRIVAIADGGALQSPVSSANMMVIPLPPLNDPQMAAAQYVPTETGGGLEYQIMGVQGFKFSLAEWNSGRMPIDFPVFGGQSMAIGPEFSVSGSVDQHGHMEIFTVGFDGATKKKIRKDVPTRGNKGLKLPFIEVGLHGSLGFGMSYSESLQEWRSTGSLEVGANAKYDTPQVLFLVVPPIYGRAELSLDLAFSAGIQGWTESGPVYSGSFQFEPLGKAIAGVGIAKVTAIEFYAGTGFHSGYEFAPNPGWISPYAIILGGARAIFGPMEKTYEIRWKWPEQQNTTALPFDRMLRSSDWPLLSRDYLNYGAEEPTKLIAANEAYATLAGGSEAAIQTVVFPYSTPDVVPVGNDMLAVWVADDTGRSLINRTELTFARYSGTTWGTPAPVADDGTADVNPRLVTLPGGNAACIWQDANAVLSDTDDLTIFSSHLEIAVATYDRVTGTWSSATRLTNDTALDRSPNIAAPAADNMLAVWVNNAANDTWGSATAPNSIMWSACDGATWSTPTAVATGLGTILDTALAYDGTTGTFIYVVDPDDSLDTTTDQEMWVATYSGGAWSAPARLTNNAIVDTAPRLAYDASGSLRLAWLSGDNIRLAAGTDVANSTVAVTPGESMSSKDFDLVMGSGNQIALVWSDASETYNDVWTAYYDPTHGVWSDKRQLTSSDAAERFISGAFDASGTLFCVYDRTQTEYEDRQELVNGQWVTVQGVPKAGQSDLYYLVYEMGLDLAVVVEDVNADPPNPQPGTATTITAKVKNLGEAPAANVAVGFYDGDPNAGGTLIGSVQAIAGPMLGGGDSEASVAWTAPNDGVSHQLFVVVDPAQTQPDRDWANNAASFAILAPDITVGSLQAQAAGLNQILTVRVANVGALPASNVTVSLRQTDANGAEIGNATIPAIAAGAYYDVPFTWASVSGDEATAFAVLDGGNSIDEFDEDNNSSSVRFAMDTDGDGVLNFVDNCPTRNNADQADADGDGAGDACDLCPDTPGGTQVSRIGCPHVPPDFDNDGDVDQTDLDQFEACSTGPGIPQDNPDCAWAKLDGDDDVDQSDFAIFQRCYSGENMPADPGCTN
ncbi:MAG: CARDB domain-containing protein [Phycisphaerae bacterium]|nr:CARDB domain-containing protein [Phycisphaerae bacterium]